MIIAGCHRVNGRLAVSRAIGDNGLKEVVSGVPDVVSISLNGNEDFLLMACDGLWDFCEEDDAALVVYEMLVKNEGESHLHSFRVVQRSESAISGARRITTIFALQHFGRIT